ncbi:MAG: UDP-N-acetylmuramate--L-alanine ligase [Phycisphaerales bacterium]
MAQPHASSVAPAPPEPAPGAQRALALVGPSDHAALVGRRLHMVGVGGCGMSGLARLLRARGAVVTGDDMTETTVLDALRADGFQIRAGDHADIPEGAEAMVVSAAVKPDHPLVQSARAAGVPVLTYAEMLGACMAASTGVAVAGTHGKSTTAAMLGYTLARCGLDPTVIVGANSAQLAGASEGGDASAPGGASTGFRLGSAETPIGAFAGRPGVLIAEACEFNRSFHNFRPTIGSISAVEADHLDIYGSLDAVVEAFAGFARLLPPAEEGGFLLIAHDGAHRREVCAGLRCRVETIGFSPAADWRVEFDAPSRRVLLSRAGVPQCAWLMQIPGEHNAMNSAVACALAIGLGADPAGAAEALGDFRGVERRCECLGDVPVAGGSVRVYDDYGHHPTEIDCTLRALREHERPQDRGGRLVCVFQPHQHSRTRFLLEEFAQSFTQADIVIVPHIYFVRDSEIEKTKVSAADLVDRLRARGVRAMHLYPFDAIVDQLRDVCRPNDLVVVMGAGPVWKVAHAYMGRRASAD